MVKKDLNDANGNSPFIGNPLDIDKSIEEFDALKIRSRRNNDYTVAGGSNTNFNYSEIFSKYG